MRAWYRPDPGTEPLPAYINGTVRAEYRLQDIDPSCPGFSKNAADFLWFRVVRDFVQFRGTAVDDVGFGDMVAIPSGDPAAIEAANIAKVTRQIARLLAKRFEATPHPVSKRFRRGSLRSLNNQGGSAIALPLGLNGDPWGNIHTVDNVLLNGADLAVGVNVNYLMSVAQKAVQPFASFALTVAVHIDTPWPAPDIDTVYHVGVHPPAVEWIPHGTFAVFKIRIKGWANTNSVLPNATFDIEQDIVLNFGGSLWLSPGSLKVTVACQRHLQRHHGQHREGQYPEARSAHGAERVQQRFAVGQRPDAADGRAGGAAQIARSVAQRMDRFRRVHIRWDDIARWHRPLAPPPPRHPAGEDRRRRRAQRAADLDSRRADRSLRMVLDLVGRRQPAGQQDS